MLITDQSSSSGTSQAVAEAALAQSDGIKIFTIGARQSNFNETELQLIASVPRLEYHQWWALTDFSSSSLSSIEVMVDNELCRPERGRFHVPSRLLSVLLGYDRISLYLYLKNCRFKYTCNNDNCNSIGRRKQQKL